MKGNHQITLFSQIFQHLKSPHATLLFIVFAELVIVGYIALSSSLGASFRRPTPVPISTQSHTHRQCNVTRVKSWKNGMVTLLQPRIKANCTALRTGDEGELRTVKKRIKTWVNAESDEEFLKTLSNCSHIVEEYSSNFYVSPEEENFPLACGVYQCEAGFEATESHIPTSQFILHPPRCKSTKLCKIISGHFSLS